MRSSTADGHALALVEILDLGIGGMGDEFGRRGAHHQQAGLEVAAGVGNHGIAVHAIEGVADLGIAADEGEAVGEEADHRNDAEPDNAGADRQPGEKSRDVTSWSR